jgi:hypothetical protein
MTDPLNHPFAEVAANVARLAALGHQCYQKFTCAGCGRRLTLDEPNVMARSGSCPHCPAVTDIERDGCNFLLVSGAIDSQADYERTLDDLFGKNA